MRALRHGTDESKSRRTQELKPLMDHAEQSTGGTVVTVIAYKADHVTATEQLNVLDATARDKKALSGQISEGRAVDCPGIRVLPSSSASGTGTVQRIAAERRSAGERYE